MLPAVVVMNNSDLALRLQARYPGMLVVYRRWPDDCIPQHAPDPAAWMRLMADDVPDARIALYAGNEPGPECRREVFVDWTLAALDEADKIGRRLVVFNVGMGGPEDDEWRGALLPLLARIGGTQHVIGLHEYADWHNWQHTGYDPLMGDNWLIGRYRRMFDVCDARNIPRPLVVITEHGYDSLRAEYHGWRAGQGVSEAEYAADLMEMDGQVYATPEIVGTCVFCWDGTGGGWETFNVKDAPILLEVLAVYAKRSRENEQVDLNNRERVRVRPQVTYTNVRAGAGTHHAIVARLEGPRYAMRTVDAENASGYDWRYYEFEDGAPNGWLADAAVVAEPQPLPEPPPPEEPPAPEPTPDPMTPERWLTLLTAWETTTVQMINTLTDMEAGLVAFRAVLVETIEALDGDAA